MSRVVKPVVPGRKRTGPLGDLGNQHTKILIRNVDDIDLLLMTLSDAKIVVNSGPAPHDRLD